MDGFIEGQKDCFISSVERTQTRAQLIKANSRWESWEQGFWKNIFFPIILNSAPAIHCFSLLAVLSSAQIHLFLDSSYSHCSSPAERLPCYSLSSNVFVFKALSFQGRGLHRHNTPWYLPLAPCICFVPLKQFHDGEEHVDQSSELSLIVQITSVHLLHWYLLISICYEHAAHLWREKV